MDPAAKGLVFRGARLIDGKGGKPLEEATIVVESGRISRVARGPLEFAPEARVIDVGGKSIIPGLIDNHVHYRSYCGELFLAHGVTSVRDLGNPLEWILAVRDGIEMGKLRGPRIFCAGGGFYGRATAEHHTVANNAEEARRMTRELIALGVDYVKTHLGLPVEIVRAVAEEAHRAGLKVTGHLDASIVPYAEAGIDGVEHATGCAEATIRSEEGKRRLASIGLWLAKFLAPWTLAERENFPALLQFLARTKTFIEPTLVLWGAALGLRRKWEAEDYELLKEPGLAYISENERLLWLDHYYMAYGPRRKDAPEKDVVVGNRYSIYGILPEAEMRDGFSRLAEFLAGLVSAGGNVVAGTDAPAVMPGVSLHREMELLVAAGLSPMQAIVAATRVGAEYLGRGEDLGTVEEGKLADFVVVDGDPLADITHTRRIVMVVKEGEIVDTGYHASHTSLFQRCHTREFYGYPAPTLERISPSMVFAGDTEPYLVVKGSGFFPGSVVFLDGSPLPTRFVDQTEVVATVPAYALRIGTLLLCVRNPKPHEIPERGGASNTLPLTVRFPSRRA